MGFLQPDGLCPASKQNRKSLLLPTVAVGVGNWTLAVVLVVHSFSFPRCPTVTALDVNTDFLICLFIYYYVHVAGQKFHFVFPVREEVVVSYNCRRTKVSCFLLFWSPFGFVSFCDALVDSHSFLQSLPFSPSYSLSPVFSWFVVSTVQDRQYTGHSPTKGHQADQAMGGETESWVDQAGEKKMRNLLSLCGGAVPPSHGLLNTECNSLLWATQQYIVKAKRRLWKQCNRALRYPLNNSGSCLSYSPGTRMTIASCSEPEHWGTPLAQLFPTSLPVVLNLLIIWYTCTWTWPKEGMPGLKIQPVLDMHQQRKKARNLKSNKFWTRTNWKSASLELG